MAAPSGTVWGSTVNDYGKIGLYVTTSNATASVSVSVQVWLATKYSCSAWGHLYFNDNATSASTLISNMIDIETYENSGSGWSSSNQILLYSTSFTVAKTSSAQTRNVAAKLDNVSRVGGVMTVKTSYSVGASSSSGSNTTTIKPTASKERNAKTGTSWANYSYDADCASYDGGYTVRAGGSSSSNNWNGWYTFPTGSSFLDPAKYEITAASFKVYQPYFSSANGYSGSGTIRARIGQMTVSGTNGLSSTAQTVTTAAKTTDGTWYEFSNILTGAKALQSGTANGIYMDVSDWSTKYWYSRLTYHGGSSYYPRISLTYKSKSYTLSVPSVSNATVSGGGTFVWGTTVNVSCTPKTGYHFSKWTLSGGSTATSTSASWSFTMPTANTTATASVAANTYSVKYNANGGSGSMSNSSHTYGTAKTLTANAFTRTGYTFNGWNTQANGSGQSYSNSQSVSNLTATHGGTVNLYAQWVENSITFKYYSNNASSTNFVNWTAKYASTSWPNNHYNYTSGTYKQTYTGYTATGNYGTTSTGGTLVGEDESFASYSALCTKYGVNVATKSTTINIYCQWTPNTIKLTLDANGGSGGTTAVWYKYGTNTFYSDASCSTAITKITAPTKTGYTYKQYNGDGTSGGTEGERYIYTDGSFATDLCTDIYKDATLTAEWTVNTYTITYNANGGSGAPSAQTYTYASSGNVTLSSTVPTRSGYTFLGWSTSSTATSASYSAGGNFSQSTASNTTLYAIWRKTITITYNANNGSGAPSASTGYIYNAGTNVSITLSSTTPTRAGYTFLGWNTSSSATSSSYSAGTAYNFSENTTLYAVWDYTGVIRIGSNKYLPYAYINGAWQRVMPYVYDTSTSKWKETGSNS